MTLIDTEAAALILQLTPRHVRNLVHAGTLTNHGTPRRIQLDPDQVDLIRRQRHHERMRGIYEIYHLYHQDTPTTHP